MSWIFKSLTATTNRADSKPDVNLKFYINFLLIPMIEFWTINKYIEVYAHVWLFNKYLLEIIASGWATTSFKDSCLYCTAKELAEAVLIYLKIQLSITCFLFLIYVITVYSIFLYLFNILTHWQTRITTFLIAQLNHFASSTNWH